MNSPAPRTWRLEALGVPRVLAEEGRAQLLQRRRLALLAVLAAAGGRGVPRDRLLVLFWPERDQASARHALEQALYALRRDLGTEAVAGVDPVSLGVGISCDISAFEEAISRTDWAAAIHLYGGPFLDGLHISDAPEFEHWVDQKRQRFAAGFRRALAARALQLESTGALGEACDLWRRHSSEDPLSPEGASGQVRCLRATGQEVRARDVVEGWERMIRSELGTTPDPSVRAALDAPSGLPSGNGAATPATLPVPQGTTPPAQRRKLWQTTRALMIGVSLAVLGVLGVGIGRANRGLPTAGEMRGELVLMPFRVVDGDSAVRAAAEVLPDMIAARLVSPDGSPVRADAVRALLEGTTAPGPKDLQAVARRLGALHVLDGEIGGGRSGVAITTRLMRASGRRQGSATVVGSLDSLPALADELTIDLLREETGEKLTSAGAVPLPILQHYVWGQRDFRRPRYHRATQHLRRALTLDSTFAPAALLLLKITEQTDGTDGPRAGRLAWTYRSRLTREDRDLIESLLGPSYPTLSSARARLLRLRQHTSLYLHHADGWYALGTLLYGSGHALGEDNPWGEARSAWERALSLDSVVAEPALFGLIEMAAIMGDTGLLSRALPAVPIDSMNRSELVWRDWITAFTARDSASLQAVRPMLAALDTLTLLEVRSIGLRTGFDMAGVVAATELWAARVNSGPQRSDAAGYLHAIALDRGRPTEAAALSRAMLLEWAPGDRQAAAAVRAAWDDDDQVAGSLAAEALMAASEPLSSDDGIRASQLYRRCAAEQYRVSIGAMETADVSARMFRERAPRSPGWLAPLLEGCALYVEGMAAAQGNRPRAKQAALALDAWQRDLPSGNWVFPATLATGRLWMALGEWDRASAALERRSPRQVRYLPMTLRLAGDAAVRSGNRDAAIRAFHHYLSLRANPEPTLQAETDFVKEELRKLEAMSDTAPRPILR